MQLSGNSDGSYDWTSSTRVGFKEEIVKGVFKYHLSRAAETTSGTFWDNGSSGHGYALTTTLFDGRTLSDGACYTSSGASTDCEHAGATAGNVVKIIAAVEAAYIGVTLCGAGLVTGLFLGEGGTIAGPVGFTLGSGSASIVATGGCALGTVGATGIYNTGLAAGGLLESVIEDSCRAGEKIDGTNLEAKVEATPLEEESVTSSSSCSWSSTNDIYAMQDGQCCGYVITTTCVGTRSSSTGACQGRCTYTVGEPSCSGSFTPEECSALND